MLCDGGMAASIEAHVRAELAQAARARDGARLRLRLAYRPAITFPACCSCSRTSSSGACSTSQTTTTADPRAQGPAAAGDRRDSGTTRFAIRSATTAGDVEELLAAAVAAVVRDRRPGTRRVGEELQADRGLDSRGDQGVAARLARAARHSRSIKLPGSQRSRQAPVLPPDQAPFGVGAMKFTIVGPTRRADRCCEKGGTTWLRDATRQRRKMQGAEEADRRVQRSALSAISRSTCATGTASRTSRA